MADISSRSLSHTEENDKQQTASFCQLLSLRHPHLNTSMKATLSARRATKPNQNTTGLSRGFVCVQKHFTLLYLLLMWSSTKALQWIQCVWNLQCSHTQECRPSSVEYPGVHISGWHLSLTPTSVGLEGVLISQSGISPWSPSLHINQGIHFLICRHDHTMHLYGGVMWLSVWSFTVELEKIPVFVYNCYVDSKSEHVPRSWNPVSVTLGNNFHITKPKPPVY